MQVADASNLLSPALGVVQSWKQKRGENPYDGQNDQ
jgi:hypothetical protein